MARPSETENLENRGSHHQYTVGISGETGSLSDYFFGFSSNEELMNLDSSGGSGDGWDDLEEDEFCQNSDQRRAFWESQEQLIQSILYRTTIIEAKIRQATRESLQDLSSGGFLCICQTLATGDCRSCLRKEVYSALLRKGYRCTICKSKWRSSSEILSGEHTFLEVVDGSNPKKGDVRVIIELNFTAEFEMARATDEYKRLIAKLPDVFVGKEDRLRSVIKALCAATKRCMEEMNLHLGPWRKHKYMQAKWLGKCERSTPTTTPLAVSGRPARATASLLTLDLGNKLSDLQCTTVKVL